MPLPNVENVQPVGLAPLVNNVRPIGIVTLFNIAPALCMPNTIINNQGRPPSPPRGQDGQRLAVEVMVMPNPMYAPQ